MSKQGCSVLVCTFDYLRRCYWLLLLRIRQCCSSRRGRFSLLGVFQNISTPTSQPHLTRENVPGSLGLYHTVCSPVLLPCCVHPVRSVLLRSSLLSPEALIKVCSAIRSCALTMTHTLLQSNKYTNSPIFSVPLLRARSPAYVLSPAFLIDKWWPCAMEVLLPCFTKLVSSRR